MNVSTGSLSVELREKFSENIKKVIFAARRQRCPTCKDSNFYISIFQIACHLVDVRGNLPSERDLEFFRISGGHGKSKQVPIRLTITFLKLNLSTSILSNFV